MMNKGNYFDGIRGFAFLLVLFMHGIVLCVDGTLKYLQGCPKYGVWLFFVLSAFLLTKNYILNEKPSKLEYLVGRVFRIIPLYYLCCITYIALGLFPFNIHDDLIKVILANYGPGHLWTVPVEFYFYLILFLIWLVPLQWIRDVIFAFFSIIVTIFLCLHSKDPSSTDTLWYLPSFFVGYGLARIWDKVPKVKYGTQIALATMAIFVVLSPGVQYVILGIGPSPYLMNWYIPLSMAWGLVILCSIKSSDGLLRRVFESRWLVISGSVSYSGYLFHWAIMVKFREYFGSSVATAILAVAASLIVAFLLSRFIEIPIYKARGALLRRIAQQGNLGRSTRIG